MWVWRAFIFSLSIALFTAIVSPARATENLSQFTDNIVIAAAPMHTNGSDLERVKAHIAYDQLSRSLLSPNSLFERAKTPVKRANDRNDSGKNDHKTPVYEVRFNHNVSLPPFERQAASAFGSTFQSEPIFVLVHEFLPEILGLKYFLAPLTANNAVPWYLRPDAPNTHSRLAGWKDGNTQYTGTLTYLS
ncbi:hypothetical protein [Paraglaciecola sp. 20A4]|uniref:hypothetical protein n=1 Tax=Paraglaciecola sp. 20A4 TaxID=2687288 RepID=UPI00140DFBAB|nr:hypothetical protein [Paraglaciecola sp. 20A4]